MSVRTNDEFYDLATVFNRMSLELKERRLAHEQEIAHAISIQRKLIPRGDLTVPGFAIQSFYFPGAGLGGDLFAVIPVGARYFFAMADVEGHGIAAALVGTLLKSLVEMQAKAGKSPAQILSLANRNLCVDLHLDLSVSMILIEYDFSKESLRYANAGHLPPFILRPGQAQLQELKSASLILGASQEESYQDAESRLAPGDRLFLYTDGLTEMTMENGFPFNRTGLANFLLERKSASLEVISVELMRYLERRRAEAINPDDVSFLAIERL